MKEAQEHPVAHRKLQSTMTSIIGTPCMLLRLKKSGTHFFQKLVPVGEKLIDRLSLGTTRHIGQQFRRRTAVDHGNGEVQRAVW